MLIVFSPLQIDRNFENVLHFNSPIFRSTNMQRVH